MVASVEKHFKYRFYNLTDTMSANVSKIKRNITTIVTHELFYAKIIDNKYSLKCSDVVLSMHLVSHLNEEFNLRGLGHLSVCLSAKVKQH